MKHFLFSVGLALEFFCSLYSMDRQQELPVVYHKVISKSEQESQALAYMQHKREFALLQLSQRVPNYEDRKPYMVALDLEERKALQNLALIYGQSQADRHVGAEKAILEHAKKIRKIENQRHHQELKADVRRSLFRLPQITTAAPDVPITQVQDFSYFDNVPMIFQSQAQLPTRNSYEKYESTQN